MAVRGNKERKTSQKSKTFELDVPALCNAGYRSVHGAMLIIHCYAHYVAISRTKSIHVASARCVVPLYASYGRLSYLMYWQLRK